MSRWAWLRLARIARRCGGVDLSRLPRALRLLLRYGLLAPLRWAQRRRLAQHPSPALGEDPVFVLGHWRSGTTYLQQLLGADPRHTTSTLFTSLFADVSTFRWLEGAMNAVAKALGLRHPIQRQALQLGLPAEADIGLCLGLLSEHAYTWGHVFPRAFPAWLETHVFQLTPGVAGRWLDDYERLMRRVSALAGGKRVVVKSPGDTARIPWLLERYPSARFVYLHRDPLAVYHSTRYLWSVIRSEYGLQRVDDATVHRWIVDTYARLLRRYLRDRARVPAGQLVELRFEALRRDGPGALAGVYDALGLGPVPEAVLAELRASASHTPTRYDTAPALEHELRDAWAFAFAAWPEETAA
ncbi:MAG: sulfotransferase [Planctomycetes bacterium]|nr:sulfotransferase [Planctomycetota bacterium]